ncbi:hypothetical protein ACFV14_04355 [Streptomyces zaomyceticus]|uniref:hypothetical protein n=1 Tax=Streptomyces zaomyceticus TaxID=68286 RepID=UPI0036BC6F6F
MNAIAYWLLMALAFGVQVWGQVIDLQDLTLLGIIAAFGVLGVDRLLLRADRYEEFAEAGEES